MRSNILHVQWAADGLVGLVGKPRADARAREILSAADHVDLVGGELHARADVLNCESAVANDDNMLAGDLGVVRLITDGVREHATEGFLTLVGLAARNGQVPWVLDDSTVGCLILVADGVVYVVPALLQFPIGGLNSELVVRVAQGRPVFCMSACSAALSPLSMKTCLTFVLILQYGMTPYSSATSQSALEVPSAKAESS
eukprot:CAMPEP_0180627872 /NCGR_PEP_ID=MMETSP1037_2-20121125/38607_1 /TAXON_ID=632150 /ORGANISM="Azadinium spinosum, Strain 3D9" /LENGTH=199 /DNA_ID=CAMNT_0022648531 /DNA_START=95 /DNA_END=692 /DNA_ORIENTATION=-